MIGWLVDGDQADLTTVASSCDLRTQVSAIERIVARHIATTLAPLEALADEWDERNRWYWCNAAANLRAALAGWSE